MEESTKEAELREEEITSHKKMLQGFFEKLESEMKQLFRQSTLLAPTKNVSGLGQEMERVGTLPPHQMNWNPPGDSKLFEAPKEYPSVFNYSQLSSVNNHSRSEQDLTSGQKDKADGHVNSEDQNEGSRIPGESANCLNTSKKRGMNLVVESSGRAEVEMVLIDACRNSRKKPRERKSTEQNKEHLHTDESKSSNAPTDPVAEDNRIQHLENEIKRLERESFKFTKTFDHVKEENSTLMLAVGEAKKEELNAKLEAIEVKSREADLLKEIEELKRQLSYQEGMLQSFTSVFKAMFINTSLDSGLRTIGVPEDSVLFNMHKVVHEIVDYPTIGQRDTSAKVQGSDPQEGPICSCPEEQMQSMTVTEKTTSTPHNTDFDWETFELRGSPRALQTNRRHSNGTKEEIHAEFTSCKENASSCLASQKTNRKIDWSLKKVSEEVFHDFSGDRSPGKFQQGQIWAIYAGGLPSRYTQIKKIEYDPFVLHVHSLESLEACTMQPLCCGIFKVQTGEALHSLSFFSHLMEAKSVSENIFEIYPKKGEVWAIYRNWKADFSHSDLENCEYDIVELIDDTEQSMKVSPLVRVSGFKLVFRAPRGQGSNSVIPRSELGRFCHKIPAFQLTEEKEGKLRGYWELDPAAVPDYLHIEVLEDEELILQSNNEFDNEITRLEDISELMIEEGNENIFSDVILSKVESEPQSNESVNASTSNVGNAFETEEVFQSRSALIEWCQNVGRTVNTVVITTKSEKASKSRKGRLMLGCERSGAFRHRHKIIKTPQVDDVKNISRRESSTRKCNCPFKLKGIALGEDRWKVKVLCGDHNHELPNTLVGHAFAGRLSPEETKIVAELSASGLKPKQVLETLKRRNETNLSTVKTIYNAKAKLRQMNL